MKKSALVALIVLAFLILLPGVFHIIDRLSDSPAAPPAESFSPAPDAPLVCTDQLDRAALASDTSAGRWLASCDNPDRNDQFDAYILSHTASSSDMTTYTYLIYYRHEESGLVATPTLHEGDSGSSRLDITYRLDTGREGYTLTYISLTLPAGQREPRVRLVDEEGESVGAILTVTETPIRWTSSD